MIVQFHKAVLMVNLITHSLLNTYYCTIFQQSENIVRRPRRSDNLLHYTEQ